MTHVSRGTDGDVRRVLAEYGPYGQISRSVRDAFDVITVRLPHEQLRRVPESRVRTAIETSTNCEIRIVVEDTE
jgi:hypothetical protein